MAIFFCKELVQFYLLVRYKSLVQIYRWRDWSIQKLTKHLFNSYCFLRARALPVFHPSLSNKFLAKLCFITCLPHEKSSNIKLIGITEQLRTFLPFLSHLYSLNSNMYYAYESKGFPSFIITISFLMCLSDRVRSSSEEKAKQYSRAAHFLS